jgi:hypothetical protein
MMLTGHYITGAVILIATVWLTAFVCHRVWQDRNFEIGRQKKQGGK